MKKTVLALVASQLLFAGSTFANQDNATFTVKAPKFVATCGVNATQNVAVIGDYFNYTVSTNAKYQPFVDITDWETGENKITPEYVKLDGIGYKFGEVGMPVYQWSKKKEKTHGHFRIVKKKGITLPAELTDTQLTMTVTCFNESEDFNRAYTWPNYGEANEKLKEHNSKTTFKDGKIVFPNDIATQVDNKIKDDMDKAKELSIQDLDGHGRDGQNPPQKEEAEA